jgi:hypothetical protein
MRERESVGTYVIGDHRRHGTVDRIKSVHVARADRRFRTISLVVRIDAVGRVREPDRIVGTDHDIVRRIEPLSAVGVGEYAD